MSYLLENYMHYYATILHMHMYAYVTICITDKNTLTSLLHNRDYYVYILIHKLNII